MTIVCVLLSLLAGIQAIEVCSDQPADIGFLIDESGSVGATNFNSSLDLVKQIVDDFDIGNSSVKISTFAFHQRIGDGFYFSCCNDKASIRSHINRIIFKGGGEDFEIALAFARNRMFQTNNGSRDFSLKILLFFTDGQSQIQNGGSLLHNLGVIVYAVGFGNGVDRNQLNKIATNESYVFMMSSYSDLVGQGYNDIKSQICIDVLTSQCDRNPQPCLNNGTCVWTGGSKYRCLCQTGYTDHNCQTDIDYCVGTMCYNGGTCIDGLTSFVCHCAEDFTDNLCETTGYILVVCFLTDLSYGDIRCLYCSGVENATECRHYKPCFGEEICYQQKYVNGSGSVLYDYGCREKRTCRNEDIIIPPSIAFGRRDIGRHIKCTSCCSLWWLYCNQYYICDKTTNKGNEIIHEITSHGNHELRIEMTDFDGNFKYAEYRVFGIGDEPDGYPLLIFGYTGTAGDSLYKSMNNRTSNGVKYTTYDRDNDIYSGNCAFDFSGAWWYTDFHLSNLNGMYLEGYHKYPGDGIEWYTWKGHQYSLKTVKMMFRKY